MPVAEKQPGVGPPQYSSSLVGVGRLVFDKAVAPEVVLHVVSPQSVGGFADVGFLLEVLVVVSSDGLVSKCKWHCWLRWFSVCFHLLCALGMHPLVQLVRF